MNRWAIFTDAALHGEKDHLRLGLRVRVVAEEDLAVHAAIRAFLLLHGLRADKAKRPPLELVFVLRGEFARAGEVFGFAANLRACHAL